MVIRLLTWPSFPPNKTKEDRKLPPSYDLLPKSRKINSIAFYWSSQSLRAAQIQEVWKWIRLHLVMEAAAWRCTEGVTDAYLWVLSTTQDNFNISSLLTVCYQNDYERCLHVLTLYVNGSSLYPSLGTAWTQARTNFSLHHECRHEKEAVLSPCS